MYKLVKTTLAVVSYFCFRLSTPIFFVKIADDGAQIKVSARVIQDTRETAVEQVSITYPHTQKEQQLRT